MSAHIAEDSTECSLRGYLESPEFWQKGPVHCELAGECHNLAPMSRSPLTQKAFAAGLFDPLRSRTWSRPLGNQDPFLEFRSASPAQLDGDQCGKGMGCHAADLSASHLMPVHD